MHVAFVAFALMVNSGGGGAKASPAEDELAVLVEYTVQEIGLQPHRCKASRGQKEMGQIDCSRYAGRLGAVASTWLTGDGDPAHKKPSAGQICKMFRYSFFFLPYDVTQFPLTTESSGVALLSSRWSQTSEPCTPSNLYVPQPFF